MSRYTLALICCRVLGRYALRCRTYLPAHRAMNLDPTTSLKYE